MQRRIEQPDNSANESTEGPQHLPEGQYYVEKLLAKRRKVSIVYLYIITVSHCTKLYIIIMYIYITNLFYIYTQGSKTEFFVQWSGYPMDACSWECASNIGSKPKRY